MKKIYLLLTLLYVMATTMHGQTVSVSISPAGPIVCPGTVLSAIVTGNLQPPYTYKWSTGATTSTITINQSGSYRVSVKGTIQNGSLKSYCSAWKAFTIFNGITAGISANGNTRVCPGQTVTLDATGGVGTSTYLWNTGATTQSVVANQTGTYVVTITSSVNGGCSDSQTAQQDVEVMDVAYQPQISATTPLWVCNPDFVNLNAESNFTSYQWSSGSTSINESVLMDGVGGGMPLLDTLTVNYTVGLNNQCSFTSNSVLLRSIRKPQLEAPSCGNVSLHLLTDSIKSDLVLTYLYPNTYEFEFEDLANPGVTWTYLANKRWIKLNAVNPALQVGHTYNVKVRAIINGVSYCQGNTCQIGIASLVQNSPPVSRPGNARLSGNESEMGSIVYPNPAAGYFTIAINSPSTEIIYLTVSDATGRIIEKENMNGGSVQIERGKEWQPGIYFVELMMGSEKQITCVVKTH